MHVRRSKTNDQRMSALTDRITIARTGIANLFPAYFAMVMATGIVSIAAHLLGYLRIGAALFHINIVAYCILLVLFILRVLFYFRNFVEDLTSHSKSPGFLTLVAGTNVLGAQFAVIANDLHIAAHLFCFGLGLWFVLMYLFFLMITVKRGKPTLEEGMNGIWLLMVVATESVSMLATLVADDVPFPKEMVLFLSLLMFLLGCMLYGIIITLIFYRLTFFDLQAEECAPPYWISMGAVAIVTLAGSLLIINEHQWAFLFELKNFLTGFTLMFWAMGTWWIPIVVFLGFWRHVYKLIPMTYHPQYWGMVFPLGMYTACTYRLAQATGIEALFHIPAIFIHIALGAWLLTFVGLLHKVVTRFILPVE